MVSLTLDVCWFQPASDLSSSVTVDLTSLSDAAGRTPEARNYVGGRRRLVTRQDARRSLQLAATVVDRADVDQLRDWADGGTLLLFRDTRGRAVYGALADLSVTEYAGADGGFAALSCTFVTTTDSAAV